MQYFKGQSEFILTTAKPPPNPSIAAATRENQVSMEKLPHIELIEIQTHLHGEKLPHMPHTNYGYKKVGTPTKRWKDIQTGYNLRPLRKTSQSHEEESAH